MKPLLKQKEPFEDLSAAGLTPEEITRAGRLYQETREIHYRKTDRMFSYLLAAE